MNLKLLKEVIKHLKKFFRCPSCDQEYNNSNINIVGASPDQAIFHLHCKKCQNNIVLSTLVQKNRKQRKIEHHTHDKSESKSGAAVSEDEVLDMHNFLKKFDGNFSKEFKTK